MLVGIERRMRTRSGVRRVLHACRSRLATSRTSASRRRTTTTARPRRGRRATTAATSSWPTWSTRCRGRMQIGLFAQARSALPFNVTTGVDNNRDTTINDRPDLANPDGDPRLASTYNGDLHRPRRQSAAQLRAGRRLLRSAPARVEDDQSEPRAAWTASSCSSRRSTSPTM